MTKKESELKESSRTASNTSSAQRLLAKERLQTTRLNGGKQKGKGPHPLSQRGMPHLYKMWDNMKRRIRGETHDGKGNFRWRGLPCDWQTWEEFRDWALANGYSTGLSIDRINPAEGYLTTNVEFVSKKENALRSLQQHKPRCKCFYCKRHRGNLK